MSAPDLSIILPVYKGAEIVSGTVDCLESVNKAIRDRLEVILVDDGSPDNSFDVCEALARKYTNVRVLKSDHNCGVAASRQLGMQNASGTYVTFMDQDDVLNSSYEAFLNSIQQEDADILVSNYLVEWKGNRTCPEEIPSSQVIEGPAACKKLAKGVLFKGYRRCGGVILANTIWNCIFKRELILANGIQIRKYVGFEDDWLFLIETLAYSGKVVLTPDSYYVWVIRSASQSHTQKYIPDYFEKYSLLRKKLTVLAKHTGLTEREEKQYLAYVLANALIGEMKNDATLPRETYMAMLADVRKRISARTILECIAADPHPAEKIHLAFLLLGLHPLWYSIYRRK